MGRSGRNILRVGLVRGAALACQCAAMSDDSIHEGIEEARMPKLLVMDHTGHSVQAFDPNDVVSLQEAERRFAELTGKGFTAAKITGDGKNPIIRQFDPTAEEILMIPRLRGG